MNHLTPKIGKIKNMKHKQKIKLARKMSPEPRVWHNFGIFNNNNWNNRAKIIALKEAKRAKVNS